MSMLAGALVLAFLFLAISSYNDESSFASSVQSLLVVASSTLMTRAADHKAGRCTRLTSGC